MTKRNKKTQQLSPVLYLERLYADVLLLPGDDIVFALTDAEGKRLLREDGNFEDIEAMPSFRFACQQVSLEAEAIAVTSAYLNSPRHTYWLLVSAAYEEQVVQDVIAIDPTQSIGDPAGNRSVNAK